MKKPNKKTQPAASDIGRNVPPLVREYIDAKLAELSDKLDRRFTNMRRLNMAAIKTVKDIRADARNAIGAIDREVRLNFDTRRDRKKEQPK